MTRVVKQETQLGLRVPDRLFESLRAIATRDANGISATERRLLSSAIEREQQQTGGAE